MSVNSLLSAIGNFKCVTAIILQRYRFHSQIISFKSYLSVFIKYASSRYRNVTQIIYLFKPSFSASCHQFVIHSVNILDCQYNRNSSAAGKMQFSTCWKNNACLDCRWSYIENRIGVTMNGAIYHERQVKELCALHALNNLYQQRDAFSKTELDDICYSLSPNVWINPHKSLLGLGNYDINVIMAALQTKGYEAIWFDKRKDPKCLNLDNIFGFILNVPSDYKLGFVMLPLRRRHWVAIRKINGSYYNLDSKFESPQLIGRGSDVIEYLYEQLECKEKELFIVVESAVEQALTWQHVVSDNNHIDGIVDSTSQRLISSANNTRTMHATTTVDVQR